MLESEKPWQINGVKMFKAGEIVKISKTYCDVHSLKYNHGIIIGELVSELYSIRILHSDTIANIKIFLHFNMTVSEEFLSHA